MSPLLEVEHVSVHYGSMLALQHANLSVAAGEIVCILGPNGSGKSTIVNAVAGVNRVTHGRIRLGNEEIQRLPAHMRVRRGVSLVPERRRLFAEMTLLENLQLGNVVVPRDERDENLEQLLDQFPLFRDRARQKASSFSGGEQQLIALARGLLSRPKLLIVDEPFLGLSPSARTRTIELMRRVAYEEGLGVLFIEQNVSVSMSVADRAYVLRAGQIITSGPSTEFDEARVREIFLGV